MSFLMPSSIVAYSADESDNLKVAVTQLPAPFSARDPTFVPAAAERGDDPAPAPEFTEAGVYLRSSFNDWYFRIHILPAALALGNIAGNTERTVVVWNAFFEPVTLEGFTVSGDGITADGVVPPQTIPPLEDISYVFAISGEGPAVIEGEATWTIDGETYVVPISGRRSVLFSFRPDWKLGPVTETLEWKNTLATSWDGRREQIMRTRQKPRRSISYRARMKGDEARLLDQSVFGWTGRMFGVPLWMEKVKTQADAPQGASVLSLDTTHASFVPQGSAVLYRTAEDFELLGILDVTPTSITLANTLARAWPGGSVVVPVAPGLPQEAFAFSRALPLHLDTAADFTLSPASAPLRLPNEPAPVSYRGLEMYTRETNWRTALPVAMSARRVVVDGGLGTVSARPRADFPLTTRGMSWLLKNRTEADELRAFFARREGIRVPVWMPSGAEDFVLKQQSELGSVTLRMGKSQYGSLIANHPARTDLVLIMRNGDRLARRILEANDEDGGTTVTVDLGMPYVIHPSAVKRISFLGLYRLTSDAVSFAWRTPTIAEVDTSFTLKVPE